MLQKFWLFTVLVMVMKFLRYSDSFFPCTRESIYYHLKKGVALGEFKVDRIEKEKGDFSWGSEVEKIYYALGPNAKPAINKRVKEYLKKKNG